MADLPLELDAELGGRLARALDVEGKIPRTLETLGPIAERDVLLIDAPADGIRAQQLQGIGGRVRAAALADAEDASVETLIGYWTSFRGLEPSELREAERVIRPGGRLLVVHDYGRDDVSRLRGDLPEYGVWTRRGGPFLRSGFKIRVIHCFWTFESIEEGQGFLDAAFGPVGRAVGAEMKRPRLSYNVAVYHRPF